MLSRLSMISMDELRFTVPRVALYVGLAYGTIRAIRFGICQTSKLLGLSDGK